MKTVGLWNWFNKLIMVFRLSSYWMILRKESFPKSITSAIPCSASRILRGILIPIELKTLMSKHDQEDSIEQSIVELRKTRFSYLKPCYLIVPDCQQLTGWDELVAELPESLLSKGFGVDFHPNISLLQNWEMGASALGETIERACLFNNTRTDNLGTLRLAVSEWLLLVSKIQQFFQMLEDRNGRLPLIRGIYFIGTDSPSQNISGVDKTLTAYGINRQPVNLCRVGTREVFSQGLIQKILREDIKIFPRFFWMRMMQMHSRKIVKYCAFVTTLLMCVFMSKGVGYEAGKIAALLRENVEWSAPADEKLLESVHRLEKINSEYPKWPTWIFVISYFQDSAWKHARQRVYEAILFPKIIHRIIERLQLPQDNERELYPQLLWLQILNQVATLPNPEVVDLTRHLVNQLFPELDRRYLLPYLSEALTLAIPKILTEKEVLQGPLTRLAMLPLPEQAINLFEAIAPCELRLRVDPLFQLSEKTLSCIYQRDFIERKDSQLSLLVQWMLANQVALLPADGRIQRITSEELQLKVHALYQNRYAEAWLSFLNSAQLRSTAVVNVIRAQIDAIISSNTLPEQLFQLLRNSTVSEFVHADQSQFMKLIDFVKSSNEMESLKSELIKINAELLEPVSKVYTLHIPERLRILTNAFPDPLKQWLNQIAKNIEVYSTDESNAGLNKQWRDSIYHSYQSVQNKLPFSAHTSAVASTDSVWELFGKAGKIIQFVNSIKSETRPASLETLVDDLNTLHSHKLISIKPAQLSKNIKCLRIEGESQHQEYCHGPVADIEFPIDSKLIRIFIEDFAGNTIAKSYQGDWALFKWWQAGRWSMGSVKNSASFRQSIRQFHYTVTITAQGGDPHKLFANLLIPKMISGSTSLEEQSHE